MQSLALLTPPALESSVIYRSPNPSYKPESDCNVLLECLFFTRTESLIESLNELPRTADKDHESWTLIGGIRGLRKIAVNTVLISRIALLTQQCLPEYVDKKDLEFFVSRAKWIEDNLILILKRHEEAEMPSRPLMLRSVRIARLYAEVYGRVFAIAEHHDFSIFNTVIESL